MSGASGAGPRALLLPLLAVGLVAAVLGVQHAQGGGDFAPARSADPCVPRVVVPVAGGVEGLSEQLVLLGLDGAACRLGVSREALVLRLAGDAGQEGGAEQERAAQADAVRAGLRDAVDRLDREGALPRTSELADEVLDDADLPGFVVRALRAVPDSLVDGRLETDQVLRRAVDELDVPRLLDEVEDPTQVQSLVDDAVTTAVRDELLDGLPNPFD